MKCTESQKELKAEKDFISTSTTTTTTIITITSIHLIDTNYSIELIILSYHHLIKLLQDWYITKSLNNLTRNSLLFTTIYHNECRTISYARRCKCRPKSTWSGTQNITFVQSWKTDGRTATCTFNYRPLMYFLSQFEKVVESFLKCFIDSWFQCLLTNIFLLHVISSSYPITSTLISQSGWTIFNHRRSTTWHNRNQLDTILILLLFILRNTQIRMERPPHSSRRRLSNHLPLWRSHIYQSIHW